MRALIFAAGRGERMRPWSDVTPKPLLAAGGQRLIEWQLTALQRAGVHEVVVNTAHLPEAFPAALGDGRAYGLRLTYAREGHSAADALETLGGIVHALPLLGDTPFVAVAADVVTDYDYSSLHVVAQDLAAGHADAHLVLVDNPDFHPQGDMALDGGQIAVEGPRLTYAGIGVYAPRLFTGLDATRAKLFPWLYAHVATGRVTGEHYRGFWTNVGTPADLMALDAALRARGAA